MGLGTGRAGAALGALLGADWVGAASERAGPVDLERPGPAAKSVEHSTAAVKMTATKLVLLIITLNIITLLSLTVSCLRPDKYRPDPLSRQLIDTDAQKTRCIVPIYL